MILPTIDNDRIARPCDECVLSGTCNKISVSGSRNSKYLVVTSSPYSNDNAIRGSHFGGEASRVFTQAMKEAGFSKDEFVFHAHIKCSYVKDTFNTADKNNIWKSCRENFLRVVEQMNPEVIICLGADAARTVYGRAKKITKIRGLIDHSEEFDCHVYSMYDPVYVANYPQHWGVFRADFQTLSRLDQHDYDQVSASGELVGEYEIVDDLQFLIDQAPTEIALDVETEGLRWQDKDKKLLTIQVSTAPGNGYLISWDHPEAPAGGRLKRKLRRQLRELLCRPECSVFGQNIKFDALWMITRTGVRIRIDHDTLLLSTLHDENNNNKDLSTLVKMHVPEMAGYDDVFNATYDKSKMNEVPLSAMLSYGAGDTDACFRLKEFYIDKIQSDDKLWHNYRRVVIPALNAFVRIELRGMICEETRLKELELELEDHVLELERDLMSQVPNSIKRKHIDVGGRGKGLRFSRGALILDILFMHKDGFKLQPRQFTKGTKNLKDVSQRIPSTSSKGHLPYFFDECPFTEQLAEYKKLDRLLGTSIKKFRENYLMDGMIYPSYLLHGTVTGRVASRDPNGQNFVKRGKFAKKYRRIFIPPPGYVYLKSDLSQAELRIVADMANERHMIDIYNSGGDIHRSTALIVTGMTEEQFSAMSEDEQDLARFRAKAVNFGEIYGMWWKSFRVYAKTQYGVEFSEAEAQRICEEFFERYPGLKPWHESMKSFARKNGFVRSYCGRVRHLPTLYSSEEYIRKSAERQSINSAVQCFGSNLGVIALSDIEAEIDPQYLAVNGFVHDEICAIAPIEYAEWAAKTMKYYMERLDIKKEFGIDMQVPIIADVTMGLSGGEQYELKGLDIYEDYDFEARKMNFDLPPQENPPNDGLADVPDYLRMLA